MVLLIGSLISLFPFMGWKALVVAVIVVIVMSAAFLIIEKSNRKKIILLPLLIFSVLFVFEAIPRYRAMDNLKKAQINIEFGNINKGLGLINDAIINIESYKKVIKTLHLPDFLAVVPRIQSVNANTGLAKVAIATGDYSKAAEHLQELETGRGIYTSKNTKIQTTLLRAELYHALGDRAKEKEMIKNAWEAANKTFNRPYWTAHVNRYRARLEMEKGNYDEAIKILKDVEKVGKRIGSYRLVLSAAGGMGDTYFKHGKYPEAEKFYSEALKLSQKYKAKGDEAQYLLRLAMAQRQTGNIQVASTNLSQAITLSREISAHEILWQGLYKMGLFLEGQGKKDEALKNYTDAISVIEQVRGSLTKEEYRLGYTASKMPVYEKAVLLSHQRGKGGDAFAYTQRGKSRTLLDLLGTRMLAYRDKDRELGEKEQSLQLKINALLERVSEEEAKPKRLQSRKLKEWKEELQKALKDHAQVEAEIERTNPRLASLTTVSTANVSDAQKVLHPDEVFLEYLVTDEKTFLYAITRSDFRVFDISLDKKRLGELVSQIYQDINSYSAPSIAELNRAYKIILEPVMKYFGNKKHLIIAPHDKLYLLPFETLVMNTGTPVYVIDRYFVSYYPSASVLVLNRKYQEKKPLPGRPLFAVGDPVFSADDSRYPFKNDKVTEVAIARKERGALYRRVMMDDAIKPTPEEPKAKAVLDRLEATGREVRDIGSLWKVSEKTGDIKIGLSASEKEVKEADHTQYRYEHYATHGVLRGDIPGLKEPALVFSLPNPKDPAIDEGFWTMSEIFGLRTNADMVVLSACKTALGEEVPGEGLIGLTRAFMYAGTPSVVASLWSVADESTAKLMTLYYRYLKQGRDKAEALSLAKRELRRQGYYNPYYWAPFILVGER